ncbi:hypothetical protein SCHPADRAFT_940421 [Schizopora paradoxa]|uniref:N-acetyltransferase domain-containing protein n=1 Tax=Schizopora paradoxa TaxID=27342 RepID=A0A0H2RV97_9AGAM|nr:hypothetical protein SCHPADRAFT_940421 [Schizopora paradoxa]
MLPERPRTPPPSIGGLYFCPPERQMRALGGPGRTKSKDTLGSSVKITTCKTIEELEGTTEVELLNFPSLGALDSKSNHPSGLQRLTAALHPLRLPLQKEGVPPRLWPDFRTTLAQRERSLIDRTTIILKATMKEEESGLEKVVAMAKLTVPPFYKANQRSWMDRMKSELLHPIVDSLSSRVCEHYDGTNRSVEEIYLPEIRKKRDEVMRGRECFELELFAVHPSCHRRGVGKVLLQHCLSLADSWDAPLILESTSKGYPFYIANGFKVVSRSRVEYEGNVYEWPVMLWEPSNSATLLHVLFPAVDNLVALLEARFTLSI